MRNDTDYAKYRDYHNRSAFAQNAEAASTLTCSVVFSLALLLIIGGAVLTGVAAEMAALNKNHQVCVALVQWQNCTNIQSVQDTDNSRQTTFDEGDWNWLWDDNTSNQRVGGVANDVIPLAATEGQP